MPNSTVPSDDPRARNPLIDPPLGPRPTEVQRRRKALNAMIWIGQFCVGLFGIASILGGVALALMKEDSNSIFSHSEHPYAGWGIGAAIAGAAATAFMLAVLAYLDLRLAESEAQQRG